jgi:hypothetical protein
MAHARPHSRCFVITVFAAVARAALSGSAPGRATLDYGYVFNVLGHAPRPRNKIPASNTRIYLKA